MLSGKSTRSQAVSAHLSSQHSGGRGRQISQFEASLIYSRASSRQAELHRESLPQNKPTKHPSNKQNNKRVLIALAAS